MASIRQMLRKFEQLDTDSIIQDVMIESQDKMADLNAEQINSGIKADGSVMPDYSFRSVFQYGKPPGPIKLRDTGAWQQGLYARVEGDKVVFASSDSKNDKLIDKYGVQIVGLSEKFKIEVIRESIRPGIKEKMFVATGLMMK